MIIPLDHINRIVHAGARGAARDDRTVLMNSAKQIVYRYNGDPNSQEFGDDLLGQTRVPDLGTTIERNGELWKVVKVDVETRTGPAQQSSSTRPSTYAACRGDGKNGNPGAAFPALGMSRLVHERLFYCFRVPIDHRQVGTHRAFWTPAPLLPFLERARADGIAP